MPFRNSAPYLAECLESICKQTYLNWELLAVDDHSEDHGRDIVQSYSQKDSRIQIFTNTGHGIIPALRTAFSNSKGGFVTRMDSDDIMVPHRLQYMVDALVRSGSGNLAVGAVQYFSDRGISEGYQKYEAWLNRLIATGSNYTELYKECVIPSPCWMAYRDDLLKAGAFDSDRYPEDYDLAFRFYETDLTPLPCTEVLHRWRDYDRRTSRNHKHYAQNYFLDIKLFYFLKLHYDPDRPLTVWGAGYKGKEIAKGLQAQGVPFTWYCDNPQKIGKKIYGIPMKHFGGIGELQEPQCIITVANAEAQSAIRSFLKKRNMRAMEDYFFFC